MKNSILQHFSPEEASFVEEVQDWQKRVEDRSQPVLTDFLNRRQQWVMERILGKSETYHYAFFGGYDQAEARRGVIVPYYEQIDQDSFQLQAYELDYPSKFSKLTHSQIMGTILAAGIQRNRLGDILTDGERWQVVLERELGPYLADQLDRVGRTAVRLRPLPLSDLVHPLDEWEHFEASLSSLRLDLVLAEGFHLSRAKAKAFIQKGQARINWLEVTDPSHPVQIQDIISLRHYGRLRLDEIGIKTRKGKYRCSLSRLSSKKS